MSQKTLKVIKQVYKQNGLFLSLSALLLLLMLVLLLLGSQQSIHLMLNSFHTSFLDTFFKYYTKVGEYGIYILVVVLLFYKLGDALFVLCSELGIGLLVQILKRIVAAPRPATVFDVAHNPDVLPLVEGVKMNLYNSFPSGHTATFVTLFFVLSILFCRNTHRSSMARYSVQIGCFLAAFIGAFSRIYLSQHFLADVFAGACLSLLFVPVLYALFVQLRVKAPQCYDWHIAWSKSRKAKG